MHLLAMIQEPIEPPQQTAYPQTLYCKITKEISRPMSCKSSHRRMYVNTSLRYQIADEEKRLEHQIIVEYEIWVD